MGLRAAALTLSRPGYPRISRGWAPAITANAHLCPLLPVLAEPQLAATRTRSAGWGVRRSRVWGETDALSLSPGPPVLARVYGVWPRIRLMPRTDSSDFGKNPAAGLSAISSA